MSDIKEFKNENMVVIASEQPGCLLKLEVKATPVAAKAAYQQAIKTVNKEVSIPGFRKGRAPNDLVVAHYKKYIDEEWREVSLNTAFSEALSLVKMQPMHKNAIKAPQIKKLSLDEGLHFTIEFETHPQVPDIDASALSLPEVKEENVSEKDVDNLIEDLRLRSATWNDVEERGVQEGDFVDLDIESLDEPGLMICENTRFSVSDKTARWMHKLLLEATPGSILEGVSEKEENDHSHCNTDCTHDHAHEEFKPTRCKITLKAIKEAVLPELNEEFVKKSSYDSIEKFREGARERLQKDAVIKRDDLLKDSIKKQLQSLYQFEVPGSFVTTNNPDEEKQLRLFFLASEFAKKHGIQVTNNEVYQAAVQEVMTKGDLAADLMNEDGRRVDSARTILYTNLLIEKVLNRLLSTTREK